MFASNVVVTEIKDFCITVTNGIFSVINLSVIAKVIIAIIGIGLVANFAWYFASFGYHFIVSCLQGKEYELFYGEKRSFKGMVRNSARYSYVRGLKRSMSRF